MVLEMSRHLTNNGSSAWTALVKRVKYEIKDEATGKMASYYINQPVYGSTLDA